jgi:hypothetical protein
MGDVRPRLTDVAAHFAHHADVIVAVEEVVLVFPRAGAPAGAMRGLVRLEGGIAQDHDEALGVLVAGGDGHVLFSHEFWQLWGRHRLGSCRLNGHVSTVGRIYVGS